jgi:hypothetical protein
LTARFRRRAYGDLVLEHQSELDEEGLSDETFFFLDRLRQPVRQHAEEIYDHFLNAPRTRVDFFDKSTRHQIDEIVRTIKYHYLQRHEILLTANEATYIAHIVTMNFARLCHMNYGFRQHVTNSRNQGLFKRLLR